MTPTLYHPPPEERVLPTLNADGTRRRMRPRSAPGRFLRWRQVLGWVLMVIFFALPFIYIKGKPALLLDVMRREFTFFGVTFLATDGIFLMLLMLSIFVSIFLLTALFGRAWCGYGCPQTVYMELLFRPLEYLIEGGRNETIRLDRTGVNARRALKYVVFAAISWVLANQFLAYFVGVEALRHWVLESPLDHLGAFLVVLVTAALVFVDFAYFREQMCTVACPYARIQSVLLDKNSLIVAYRDGRGEPRRKGRERAGAGDCVDCGACVTTCPTGIDIRDGLQLECIACAQCVDACDAVMRKVGKPEGLIAYTSKEALKVDGKPSWVRLRVFVYPLVLLGLLTALSALLLLRNDADVNILRGIGTPYVQDGTVIRNQLRFKVINRSAQARKYTVTLLDAKDATLIAPELPLEVLPGETRTTPMFVVTPQDSFENGRRTLRVRVTDGATLDRELTYQLLGPFLPIRK